MGTWRWAAQAVQKLRIVTCGISGWEIAHAADSRRPPISRSRIIAHTPCTPRTFERCCPSFYGLFFCRRVAKPSYYLPIRDFFTASLPPLSPFRRGALTGAGRDGGVDARDHPQAAGVPGAEDAGVERRPAAARRGVDAAARVHAAEPQAVLHLARGASSRVARTSQ